MIAAGSGGDGTPGPAPPPGPPPTHFPTQHEIDAMLDDKVGNSSFITRSSWKAASAHSVTVTGLIWVGSAALAVCDTRHGHAACNLCESWMELVYKWPSSALLAGAQVATAEQQAL